MKVVITGGMGFVGTQLAKEILTRGDLAHGDGRRAVEELLVFDRALPDQRPAWADPRVTFAAGDIADRATVFSLIDRPDVSIFHLASGVSVECEQDFDAALRTNLDGGRHVLEAARATGACPRVVAASSLAVYGGEVPDRVDDSQRQTPSTTYGMTKAILELLVNDMTRKGFIDGRSIRLPTLFVRPGRPNAAASSFVSGVIREPLHGEAHDLPVPETTRMLLLGYRAAVAGMLAIHDAPGDAIGPDRALPLPNGVYSVQEMIAALKRVAAEKGISLGPIRPKPNDQVANIVTSWPLVMAADRALQLGAPADRSLDQVIHDFIEDFM